MPDEKKLAIYEQQKRIYQQQKMTKPQIEVVINEYLDGDEQTAALDFVAWLRTNGLPLKWSGLNAWTLNYKGKQRFAEYCSMR